MVPGAVLGSYEIVSLLGAGGMGEVYRARDTRLGRDVALKLLPVAVADDGERLARFQREAQVLASLNHPNIGAIYGLEQLTPVDWSADGKWIAYADFGDRGISIATVTGLMRVDIEGDHTPRVLIKGGNGRISPTERWVATTSPTTGTDEIYVLPFPDTSRGRTRISTDGGQNPTWAPDGKTLFYRRGQAVMAVAVGGDDPSSWPKPKMLFEGPYLLTIGPTHFDVARDGRLLMVKPVDADGEGAPKQLVLVQNWFEELRRLAPRK